MPIKPLQQQQIPAIVDLSLKAWGPVFEAVQSAMSDDLYQSMHVDWESDQRNAVEAVCSAEDMRVWVSVAKDIIAGFIAVKFHEDSHTGEIYMVAVDPQFQQKGIGAALTDFAVEQMKLAGMKLAMVETGADPGHEPARRVYEDCGFEPLHIVRYFRQLD